MASENPINDWVDRNSSKLVTINQLKITGADQFRDSFIEGQFPNIFEPATLAQTLEKLENSSKSLNNFGIRSTEIDLDLSSKQPDNGPLGLIANIAVESSPSRKFTLKTLTRDDIAGVELIARDGNLFGGAETIELKGKKSTNPTDEKAVSVEYSKPVTASSRAIVSAYLNSIRAPWAGITEERAGILGKFTKFHKCSRFHTFSSEFGISSELRQDQEIASSDVQSNRLVKTGAFFNLKADNTDDAIFPLNGARFNLHSEAAGASVLPKSDVSLFKSVLQGFYARSTNDKRITLNITGSLGHLFSFNGSSSIMDRFFIGGYKDVSGFKYNGIGPHNEQYSTGGDAFAQGSIKVFTKLPVLVNSISPLRLMAFFNTASLVAVDQTEPIGRKLSAPFTSPASTSSGVGLVYKSPFAQFELIYSLPLHSTGSDQTDGGIKFGVELELS